MILRPQMFKPKVPNASCASKVRTQELANTKVRLSSAGGVGKRQLQNQIPPLGIVGRGRLLIAPTTFLSSLSASEERGPTTLPFAQDLDVHRSIQLASEEKSQQKKTSQTPKQRCRPKDRPPHARVVSCRALREQKASSVLLETPAVHMKNSSPDTLHHQFQKEEIQHLPTPSNSQAKNSPLTVSPKSPSKAVTPEQETVYVVLMASCRSNSLLRYEVVGLFRSLSHANKAAASCLETECHPQKPFANMRNLNFQIAGTTPCCEDFEGQKWFTSSFGGVHYAFNKGNGEHIRTFVERQHLSR